MTNREEGTEVAMLTPVTIDDWLPASRADWPEEVLARLSDVSQGTVVVDPPLFYYANTRRGVWRRTLQYADGSPGQEVVEVDSADNPKYGIVTSQTCDVVEDGREQLLFPWIQIAPVYERSDLNGGSRKLLREGGGQNWLYHVPALPGGFWVADLRIELPVEKSWLAECEIAIGFTDDEQRRSFGQRLAARRSRPAFAAAIVEEIQQPLVTRLRELRKVDAGMFERLHSKVDEVALRASDHLHPTSVGLTLILHDDLDSDLRGWWDTWWDETRERTEARGVNLLPLDARKASAISVAEYKRMTTMPLVRVSPA